MPITIPYATDESIARICTGDFATLVPADQRLASGVDGAFAPGVPWTMTSASVDFGAQSVYPGMVVVLTSDNPPTTPPNIWRPPGDLLVVAGAIVSPITISQGFPSTQSATPTPIVGGTLPLRRKGLADGQGDPPVPAQYATGGVTGVSFRILSCLPQIMDVSRSLDQRFGVDDLVFGRRHVDQYDPSELEQLCALSVLFRLYLGQVRGSAGANVWWEKAKAVKEDRDELARRVDLLWKNSPAGQDQSNVFTHRIMRG